ncbi:MAG: primosomal protein N', partial [Xanthomonadales bacterium]|nr:primosomal protein N' [Xanthomonadales bacterium]
MSAPDSVLRVALPVPLPRLFDYRPPAGGAGGVGCRVRVPFGSRSLVGVIAEIGPADPGLAELREAETVLDPQPLLQGELLASLRWLARYTHAPLGEVLATALPSALRRGEPLPETHAWAWRLSEAGATALARLRGRPRQLADRLLTEAMDEDLLDAEVDDWRTAARALLKRGLAERFAVPA